MGRIAWRGPDRPWPPTLLRRDSSSAIRYSTWYFSPSSCRSWCRVRHWEPLPDGSAFPGLPVRKAMFSLEMITMAKSDYDVVVAVCRCKGAGPRIRDLALPEGAVITLVCRGDQVVPPKGETRLKGWDQVTVLAHAPDEDRIRETFMKAFQSHKTQATMAS